MRKISAFLAALFMVCIGLPFVGAAQTEQIQPLWNYVTFVTGTINITSFGTAKVTAEARAESMGVTKTSVTASLQQYKNNKWEEVQSWTASNNSKSAKIPEKSWAVAHGYSYRLVVTGKAYMNTTLLETGTYTVNYGYFK